MTESSGRVAGKVTIVTGAASNPGLGRTTALMLAAQGARLVLTDIDLDGAQSCADEIKAAGGDAIALKQDVTDEAGWDALMAATIEQYGRLDVLVNNAGIAVLDRLENLSLAQWNKQIDVNMTSVFLGCRAAIKPMRAAGGGSIINLSSVAGLRGLQTCSAYGAAKGGVRIMSKSIAVELAPDNIRCNSVHPGVIWTNMQAAATGSDDPADARAATSRVPLGRAGKPEDIANCVLYLASEEANYVTGAEFVIDAGMTAQ